MYTIVVADDEEEIRKSLIRKVDWESLDFQVVGEAENGEEALDLVEKFEPDLLITDIKMPFVTGIELARQVREIRPMTNIAFISGYDDFTFAQQAIQYNIISYMLKPISAAELTEELRKIHDKIEERFREFTEQTQVHEASGLISALLLDNFQMKDEPRVKAAIIDSALSSGLIQENNLEDVKYTVLVTMLSDKNGENCTQKASVHAVSTILNKYLKHITVYGHGKIVSLLAATPRGFDKYLHILVEDIRQSVQRILNLNSVMGVSRITGDIMDAHECYLEAMNALAYSRKTRSGVYFITDQERAETFDQEMVQSQIDDISEMVRRGTEEEIEDYVRDFFENVKSEKIAVPVANGVLIQLVSIVLQITYSVAGKEAVVELQKTMDIHNIFFQGDIDYSYGKILEFCLTARTLIANQRKQSSEILCDRAIKLIQEYYGDSEVSLVTVSSEIAVSPNHLSVLLKKKTGMTFKELLTKKRMEMARELLLCTAMKIREVSEKCGYNDQHYFSYCFKKYYNESPNMCRRSHEEN